MYNINCKNCPSRGDFDRCISIADCSVIEHWILWQLLIKSESINDTLNELKNIWNVK